jgi:predicted amidohydrolase
MNHNNSRIRLSLLQINPSAKENQKRLTNTLQLVRDTARKYGGIVVLPEIWSGGFEYPDIKRLANETSRLQQELARISREHPSVIIGSLPEKSPRGLYNTASIMDQGKLIGRYRKQRLFPLMEEDRHFTTCRSRKKFSTSRGTIGIAVCFDLRFPELFTSFRDKDTWLVIVPAQWPASRLAHWKALLVARAIENQIYVAGCNRVGQSGDNRFGGNSMIVDPWGQIIAQGGRGTEVITAVIRPSRILEVRQKIPMTRTPRRG